MLEKCKHERKVWAYKPGLVGTSYQRELLVCTECGEILDDVEAGRYPPIKNETLSKYYVALMRDLSK